MEASGGGHALRGYLRGLARILVAHEALSQHADAEDEFVGCMVPALDLLCSSSAQIVAEDVANVRKLLKLVLLTVCNQPSMYSYHTADAMRPSSAPSLHCVYLIARLLPLGVHGSLYEGGTDSRSSLFLLLKGLIDTLCTHAISSAALVIPELWATLTDLLSTTLPLSRQLLSNSLSSLSLSQLPRVELVVTTREQLLRLFSLVSRLLQYSISRVPTLHAGAFADTVASHVTLLCSPPADLFSTEDGASAVLGLVHAVLQANLVARDALLQATAHLIGIADAFSRSAAPLPTSSSALLAECLSFAAAPLRSFTAAPAVALALEAVLESGHVPRLSSELVAALVRLAARCFDEDARPMSETARAQVLELLDGAPVVFDATFAFLQQYALLDSVEEGNSAPKRARLLTSSQAEASRLTVASPLAASLALRHRQAAASADTSQGAAASLWPTAAAFFSIAAKRPAVRSALGTAALYDWALSLAAALMPHEKAAAPAGARVIAAALEGIADTAVAALSTRNGRSVDEARGALMLCTALPLLPYAHTEQPEWVPLLTFVASELGRPLGSAPANSVELRSLLWPSVVGSSSSAHWSAQRLAAIENGVQQGSDALLGSGVHLTHAWISFSDERKMRLVAAIDVIARKDIGKLTTSLPCVICAVAAAAASGSTQASLVPCAQCDAGRLVGGSGEGARVGMFSALELPSVQARLSALVDGEDERAAEAALRLVGRCTEHGVIVPDRVSPVLPQALLRRLQSPSASIRTLACRAMAPLIALTTEFSDDVPAAVSSHRVLLLDSVSKRLGEAMPRSIADCLNTIASVGWLSGHAAHAGGFMASLLALLVRLLGSEDAVVRAAAHESIKAAARMRSISARSLIDAYLSDLCATIGAETLLYSQYLLSELAFVMDLSVRALVRSCAPFLLPGMFFAAQTAQLQLLAEHACDGVLPLAIEQLDAIIMYTFSKLANIEDVLTRVSSMLSETSSTASLDLLVTASTKLKVTIVRELGSCHHARRELALGLLHDCARLLYKDAEDAVVQFLQPSVMELVHRLKQALKEPMLHQRRATMTSLTALLRLVGKAATPFLPQILGTLHRAMADKPLRQQVLDCFATLIPIVQDTEPHAVSQIIATLVGVEATSVTLQDSLTPSSEPPGMHSAAASLLAAFLGGGDHPAIWSVVYALPPQWAPASLVHSMMQYERKESMLSIIESVERGLLHDSALVASHALCRLERVLHLRQAHVHALALASSEESARAVGSLLRALLATVRRFASRSDIVHRLRACRCLGAIGAIDPSRLPVASIAPRSSAGGVGAGAVLFEGSISSATNEVLWSRTELCELAVQLIGGPIFRIERSLASPHRNEDRASYAIQELLRFCGITAAASRAAGGDIVIAGTSGVSHSTARALWNRIPAAVQPAITVCLTSSYEYNGVPRAPTAAAEADAASQTHFQRAHSYQEWISTLVDELMVASAGESTRAHTLFGILRVTSLATDIATAQALLPHVVLYALTAPWTDRSISAAPAVDAQTAAARLANEVAAVLAGAPSRMPRVDVNTCRETVFALLDALQRWQWAREPAAERIKALEEPVESVRRFLSLVDDDAYLDAALECEAHARAVMHIERLLRGPRDKAAAAAAAASASAPLAQRSARHTGSGGGGGTARSSEDLLSRALDAYRALGEPDGISGIASKLESRTATIRQRSSEYASVGRWSEARSYIEAFLQSTPPGCDPFPVDEHIMLLECMAQHGEFKAVVSHARATTDAVMAASGADTKGIETLFGYGVDAAWRLGDWKSLDAFLAPMRAGPAAPIETSRLLCGSKAARAGGSASWLEMPFELHLGHVMRALREAGWEAARAQLSLAWEAVANRLSTMVSESYVRSYPLIVQLHIMHDLQQFESREGGDDLTAWMRRLAFMESQFRAREQVLSVGRVLTELGGGSGAPDALRRIGLETARQARHANQLQTANIAVLKTMLQGSAAQSFEVELQFAKLLWESNEHHRALLELQTTVGALDKAAGGGDKTGTVRAKASLQMARWARERSLANTESIRAFHEAAISEFSEKSKVGPQAMAIAEKAYFFYGSFSDSLIETGDSASRLTARLDAIKWYGTSLQYGSRYIFQSLPRLLTLWLDFGESQSRPRPASSSSADYNAEQEALAQMTRELNRLEHAIPPYKFLTAFAQIVSRLGHPNANVLACLQSIVQRVLHAHPSQALWSIVGVANGSSPNKKRCTDLLDKVSASASTPASLRDQIAQVREAAKQLVLVCDNKTTSGTFSAHAQQGLRRLFPLSLAMPVQANLTGTLPAKGEDEKAHRPFAADQATVMDIDDTVEVLASLQRPKKINLISSTGAKVRFLLKRDDDLRKDARVIDFASMVNVFLKRDPDARKRRLRMRTYAVITLNETYALLEWVPHTVALRGVLDSLYKSRGMNQYMHQLQNLYAHMNLARFRQLLTTVPPIFHRWFLNTFADPTAWFGARLCFSRSTAVISMIGFILGLGDRHGDNILLDDQTGDCVHVDFNCVFEKGLKFKTPEHVPFRLTQNIQDGFGVSGPEGVFRRCCEVTLGVLRENRGALVTVLETLIYDPLVDWSKKASAGKDVLNVIGAKLEGRVLQMRPTPTPMIATPCSVESQVHELIRQATSTENLSVMYMGWMPHI